MDMECKPEFPAELERVMKITEGVMRCLTTASGGLIMLNHIVIMGRLTRDPGAAPYRQRHCRG